MMVSELTYYCMCTNWTVTSPMHLTDILKLIKSSILHTLVMEKTEQYLNACKQRVRS